MSTTTTTTTTPRCPTCPYCYAPLHPESATPAPYQPATIRDCTIGFVLGLAVVGFIDVGIFVRRDPTPVGFLSNLAVATVLTVLLVWWYRQMRAEVALQNTETWRTWQRQWDDAQHLYRCDRCALTFRR